MSVVMTETTTAEAVAEIGKALSKPQCPECGGTMDLVRAGKYSGGGWDCRSCAHQERA